MDNVTPYLVPASLEHFSETEYLDANKDIQEAISKGIIESGLHHFKALGYAENRFFARRAAVARQKAKKLKYIVSNLLNKDELLGIHDCGALDCLRPEYRISAGITPTTAVSSHGYDDVNLKYIESNPTSWILDVGAGLCPSYYHNVVNFEVVPYDTTDVLGIAEKLPFKDGVFDYVISSAVLEHVRNPAAAAKELYRVLKPGGGIYIAAPFLCPYHGYPHHYFNMTAQGLRSLLPEELVDCNQYVPHFFAPLWSARHLFLHWISSLDEPAKEQLLNTKVREFVEASPADYTKDYNSKLSLQQQLDIAYGTVLTAKKPLAP